MDPIIVRKSGGKLFEISETKFEDEHVQLTTFKYKCTLNILVLRGLFKETVSKYDFSIISLCTCGLFIKWYPYIKENNDCPNYIIYKMPNDISYEITFRKSHILNLRDKCATEYKLTRHRVIIIKHKHRHNHICYKCNRDFNSKNKKVQFCHYCCSDCIDPMHPTQLVYRGFICKKQKTWPTSSASRSLYGTINNSEDYFRNHPIVLYSEINTKNI